MFIHTNINFFFNLILNGILFFRETNYTGWYAPCMKLVDEVLFQLSDEEL
jgi:hypothetical protein